MHCVLQYLSAFLVYNILYAHVMLAHTQHIQWLEEDFLLYLNNWETSVRGRTGFSVAEQSKMMLSAETILGLKFTGILFASLRAWTIRVLC